MTPDWNRIFPDADHRWSMGLQRGAEAESFFAVEDSTGGVLGEKAHWLAEDFSLYAAILPSADEILQETIEYAQSIGTSIPAHQASDTGRLHALGLAWEPDFVLLSQAADGLHRVIGGVVCFPSSWALAEKMGLPMHQVHEPVPGLNDSLARQIETFLGKLEPGAIWRRENWGLSRDPHRNHHTSRTICSLDANVQAQHVWIRLEHQLLTKLPRTKGIIFGIRVEIVPLVDILAIPSAAQRMERIVSTISDTAARYKGILSARQAIVEILRCANAG